MSDLLDLDGMSAPRLAETTDLAHEMRGKLPMTPEQAEQRFRDSVLCYYNALPCTEATHSHGDGLADDLDAYAAFVRVCAVAETGCVRWSTSDCPRCSESECKQHLCPACQAEAERDAMIKRLEAE